MVRTGTEAVFKEQAERILGQNHSGSAVYFFQRRLRKGNGVYFDAPLFPGYLFLQVERLTPQVYDAVRGVKNFCRLLPTNSEPRRISGAALDELQLFIKHGEYMGVSKLKFLPGRQVKAVSGPMVGLEGCIYKINKKKKQVTVISSLSPDGKKFDLLYEDVELIGS